MEKVINILYYNFCLLNYYFMISIIVYLNPFCWLSNIKYLKLGFKIWKQQMEKNNPLFLYQMKYNLNLKYLSYQWFMIFISMFIFIIAGLLQYVTDKFYIIGFVIFLITWIGSYFYVLENKKYYEYQIEFVKNKKYSQPILLLIVCVVITILICILFFRKYLPI